MDRRDMLWIALKVAGLYLITEGVIWIPEAIVEGTLVSKLDAAVPLLAGLVVLLIRVPSAREARALDLSLGMGRGDWFWLVCKALGLWWTVHALLQVPTTIRFVIAGAMDWVAALSVGIYLSAGLFLLLTNVLPKLVAAGDRTLVTSRSRVTGLAEAAQQAPGADEPRGNQ